jgi:hypothetical protein
LLLLEIVPRKSAPSPIVIDALGRRCHVFAPQHARKTIGDLLPTAAAA